MDEFLINNGELILKKVEETLLFLKEIDYFGIIKRSMKKNEICLGRIDEGNLRVVKEIEISSLKDISYNLVEEDIYHYLRKVRRRNPDSQLYTYISKYIEDAFLGDNSREYLRILLLFPYDTIRNWRKYSINKKGLSSEDYVNIITKSMKYEMDV